MVSPFEFIINIDTKDSTLKYLFNFGLVDFDNRLSNKITYFVIRADEHEFCFCNINLLANSHSFIHARSLFMANSTSPMVSPATVRLVSSANNREVAWLRHSGKSFMYIRKRSGPRIDPWGILSDYILSANWHFCVRSNK